MREEFKFVHFEQEPGKKCSPEFLDINTAKRVNAFHRSFPMYEETPLSSLNSLATELGIKNLFVKDESYRFGLNAFKVLGGSFAMGNYLAQTLGMNIEDLPYKTMISEKIKEKIGDITFITATDGNHGRGVAWTANKLRQSSVVLMPKGSARERLDNIKAEGAKASITDLNYDDSVRRALKMAGENGWVMVQDTAWEGYEDIPMWIMQGYLTMGFEAFNQLAAQSIKPTHIFLQAGVGSLAGSIAGFFSGVYGDDCPIITIVEPNKADCVFRTARANDGKIHAVTGDMDTIMAGLACGEPCSIGWNVLKDCASAFVSVPDYVAAKGMRILGSPLPGDPRIISGESGAVTSGLLAEVMTNKKISNLKEQLRLDTDSVVLCFSTEGATDKNNYYKIVWDGLHHSDFTTSTAF